jgi:hypothetical protein
MPATSRGMGQVGHGSVISSRSAYAADVEFQGRCGRAREQGDVARGKALALLGSRVRRSRALLQGVLTGAIREDNRDL